MCGARAPAPPSPNHICNPMRHRTMGAVLARKLHAKSRNTLAPPLPHHIRNPRGVADVVGERGGAGVGYGVAPPRPVKFALCRARHFALSEQQVAPPRPVTRAERPGARPFGLSPCCTWGEPICVPRGTPGNCRFRLRWTPLRHSTKSRTVARRPASGENNVKPCSSRFYTARISKNSRGSPGERPGERAVCGSDAEIVTVECLLRHGALGRFTPRSHPTQLVAALGTKEQR